MTSQQNWVNLIEGTQFNLNLLSVNIYVTAKLWYSAIGKNINIVRNVSKIMFLELPVRVGNLELITKNQDKWVFGMQKQVLIQFK